MPKKDINLNRKGKIDEKVPKKILDEDEIGTIAEDVELEASTVDAELDADEDGGIDDEEINPFGDRWEE